MSTADAIVAASVRRLLERHPLASGATPAGASMLDEQQWHAIVAAGLPHVLHASARDDMRDALGDAVTILRGCAHEAVALPIAENIVVGWLAGLAGWEPDDLATIALDTDTPVQASVPGPSASDVTHVRVPWGGAAHAVYSLEAGDNGSFVARVQASEWSVVEQGLNLAGEPRDMLRRAPTAEVRRAACGIRHDDVLALCALLRSAQMVGAMERTLDLALEHARTRVQFGRPIGQFQAVQQMLAEHASHVAAATAAVDLAVDAWGTPNAVFYAGVAKSRAGEAAGLAAETSHQIIGAMGYAMEHPLQRVTRRLWSWRDDYGNEAFWNRRIGERVFDIDADLVWPFLTAAPSGLPEAA